MNPDTNRFEELTLEEKKQKEELFKHIKKRTQPPNPLELFRPNGEPVPQHWVTFQLGEEVVIKDYTFKVAYIGETAILFEPVGPTVIGNDK